MRVNKSNKFSGYHKRVLSLLMVLVLLFNILPQFLYFSSITSDAATLSTATIKKRFDDKMASLGWVDSTNMLVTKINDAMWQDTGGLSVFRVDAEGIRSDSKASATAIGWRITPEAGKTGLDYVVPEETIQTTNMEETGNVDGNSADSDDSVTYATDNDASYEDDIYADVTNADAASVAYYAYSGSEIYNEDTGLYSPKTQKDDLYYTIEYDKALLGYYRQYYVSTADQLATLLFHYETDFSSTLKAVASECPGNAALATKLGIVLLNDIDLGGRNGECWRGYYGASVRLEIDGQGHVVYNGHFKTTTDCFLGRYIDTTKSYFPRYFSIHDVTFSNMYMERAGGMFRNAKYAYFNNVNWQHCLAAGSETIISGNSIVFGNSYTYVHLKNCTINESYVAGNAHCALFSSYNGTRPYNANASYIGDDSVTVTSFYYTDIPDNVEEVEAAWAAKTVGYDSTTGQVTLNPFSGGYKLDVYYPSIYENCATINGAVYDAGSNHSGTFVSCIQGAMIFKDCFSNCTIYANTQLGVFTGALIGSGDGFYYPYNGEKTFVNTYFEDCYTSGAIEGNRYLGGFIGVVFDDGRITDSENRGKAVFKNCYSTSTVGMQYAQDSVGGFAGVVVGNIKSDTDTFGEDNIRHVFENCYAAGEVGGITIETSTDGENTNTIGGFFGTYVNFTDDAKDAPTLTSTNPSTGVVSVSSGSMGDTAQNAKYKKYAVPLDKKNTVKNNTVTMINCYYDKQTTAMRERDIGNASMYFYNNSYLKSSLVGTLSGLTGVYTQCSEDKSVAGLTDTVNMGDSGAWDNSMVDYYPQLKAFFNYEKPDNYASLSDTAKAMHDKRAEIYQNCALASTATVLLDHYDQYLNEYGELVDADALVYDTVRDITRKFEFTTDSSNEIAWDNNDNKNTESGYINTIDSAGAGFSVSYETIDDDGSETTAEKKHNPEVLKIVMDTTEGEQYKCTEFAPGRQWVMVTAGSGDTKGQRNLRLLPTAYLSAGGTMEVNVVINDDVLTNIVTLDDNTLPDFNHYAGVAYALTDVDRMGTITSDKQTIKMYTSASTTDTSTFAFYSGYLVTGNSTAVGLNPDTGKMYAQEFSNSKYENNSTDGMTMVKVYKTKMKVVSTDSTDKQYLLEEGDEITDPGELAKWSGDAEFTPDDVGYYYMKYYWRLNDGRYLTDYKLVKIKSSSHTVEMITGVINKEHKLYDAPDTEGFYTAVDQYVTDNITTDNEGKPTWARNYVSQDSDFISEFNANPDAVYDGSYSYNTAKTYGNDVYYIKSKRITSTEANSVVGWHRTSDYRLTTLIVEAQTPDGEWVEMARVDENSPTFDFSDAMYQYQFSGYTVTQDPDTKLFTVTEKESVNREFKVDHGATDSGVENFIEFAFMTSEDVDTNYDSSDSIRVTALFRENYADVQTEKQVLLNPKSELTKSVNVYNSLEEADAVYEVDDTDIEDTNARKAVLSGDVLTYRMKVYNAGFYDSSVVNVYDKVPEGCEYIPDSMKIYRQNKDISSGSPFYGELEPVDVTAQEGYLADYDAATGSLHWQMPTVELAYDYYVEYQVQVNQLDVNKQTELLTNTAIWDYIMLNGDLDLDNNQVVDTITSIEHYQQNAIFTMNVVEDGEASETGKNYATYEITFEQNKSATNVSYENIIFTNELPDNFAFKEGSDIELVKIDENDEEETLHQDSDYIVAIDYEKNSFTIKEFDFDPQYTYLVRFTGTQLVPTETQDIVNKANIIYDKVDGSAEPQTKTNSITKITCLSNQVETDVTHLYLNVEKTITIEESDPSQTFLFRIDRFEDEMTAKVENAVPLETFYTQVHCTNPVTNAANKVTSYQGNQLVQVDERGYYVITEVTDWSQTDYDFASASYTDISRYEDDEGTTTTRNGTVTLNQNAASVEFALPRQQYISQAFPTSLGTLAEGTYSTAGFTNWESEYAYLSGQSYSENTFKKKNTTDGTD